MIESFKILDVSGDVGLRIKGESYRRLFINAAAGLYKLITDSKIINQASIPIRIKAESPDRLLVGWLNELIYHFDAEGFIGSEIVIEKITRREVHALISGEEFDRKRHNSGLLIKAATYHNLSVTKKHGAWEAEVVFDI